jgi:anti-sigma-K factor RskA
MNTAEYISSGILEQYVTGDITPQEKAEVECMSHIYPEIHKALDDIQQAMELFALENAVPPPSGVKTTLMKRIQEDIMASGHSLSAVPDSTAATGESSVVKGNFTYRRLLAAASVLVAVSVTVLYIVSQKQHKDSLFAIQNRMDSVTQQQDQMVASNRTLLQHIDMLTSPGSRVLHMTGNEKVVNRTLTLVWNKASGTVMITGVGFPQTADDKQYQLWALDGNTPIDLGVFDAQTAMQKMKQVTTAQAFAVTIEKKGGNPTPTLSALCGIVKI